MNIEFSAIDTKRMGFNVARADSIFMIDIERIMEFCSINKIKLLIARCLVKDINVAQALEQRGFVITDTQVCYVHNLLNISPISLQNDYQIRELNLDKHDDIALKSIAETGFRDYFGHYHSDTRIPKMICDEIYADWGFGVCHNPKLANKVFVVEYNQQPVGFVALRLNNSLDGEGVLSSILPEHQGHGIYRSLIITALNWIKEQNRQRMIMSTQILNVAVQKTWVRLGFEPSLSNAFYTFHKWE